MESRLEPAIETITLRRDEPAAGQNVISMSSDSESAKREADQSPQRDALTIRRFLLLTAGVAMGLGVFSPGEKKGDLLEIDQFLGLYNSVLIGIALPAPLIIIGQRWRKGPAIGPGGLFSLMVGLGALLMLPPVLLQRLAGKVGSSLFCLFYMLPLVSVWYLAAAAMAGKIDRSLFARSTAWTERYGFLLAVLWAPMGVWWLIRFYMEAFQ